MKQKIVIIGAGLAGLSAGYYLTCSGDYDVTILEGSERIGGRVYTVSFDDQRVDIGGFMVFPWYKYFKELLHEVGMTDQLRDFKTGTEYYQIDKNGEYVKDTHVPMNHVVPLRLLQHLIIPFFTNHFDFYEPDTTLMRGQTVEQTYEQIMGKKHPSEALANDLAVSYTYADLKYIPASLYLGFGYKVLTQHGFDRCRYIEGGTNRFTDTLANEITRNGGKIILNSKVTRVSKNLVTVGDSIYHADKIIFANGLHDGLAEKVINTKELGGQSWYTNHFAVLVSMKNSPEIKGNSEWFVAYNHTIKSTAPQVVCLGNGNGVGNAVDNSVMLYVRIHPEDTKKYSTKEIKEITVAALANYLPGNEIKKFNYIQHWEQTMPVVDSRLIDVVRAHQGVNGFYFAGDYLSSPCMETAVYSGKKVASLINRQ